MSNQTNAATLNAFMELRLELSTEQVNIPYNSLEGCLTDNGLKVLFNEGLVTKCTVFCGDKRITGLPMMDWSTLHRQVKSNETAILQNMSVIATGAACRNA